MAPIEVNHRTLGTALDNLYKKHLDAKIVRQPSKRFQVDDAVRVSTARHTFKKGYKGTWNEEVFRIRQVKASLPYTLYKLKDYQGRDIDGSFYAQELQKADVTDNTLYVIETILKKRIRKGIKEIYVKWAGYNDDFNEWIPESNAVDFLKNQQNKEVADK
jgi:hypothetical protein